MINSEWGRNAFALANAPMDINHLEWNILITSTALVYVSQLDYQEVVSNTLSISNPRREG